MTLSAAPHPALPPERFRTVPSGDSAPVRHCLRCPKPLDGRRPQAKYCSDACRVGAWREKQARPPKRSGRSHSGRTISYRKAVNTLAAQLYLWDASKTVPQAVELAETILRDALPARQRGETQ